MNDRHPFEFTPVPVRARRDGWTLERQRRFVDLLAAGCGPSEAAQAVGMTKQSAFMLRGRADAASFRAAWEAALRFARKQRYNESPKGAAAAALDGVLVPRFYRGRLVAVERRFPSAPMIRVLAQLDRWTKENPESASLDDLLDMIAPKAAAPKARRRTHRTREELDALFLPKRHGYGY